MEQSEVKGLLLPWGAKRIRSEDERLKRPVLPGDSGQEKEASERDGAMVPLHKGNTSQKDNEQLKTTGYNE